MIFEPGATPSQIPGGLGLSTKERFPRDPGLLKSVADIGAQPWPKRSELVKPGTYSCRNLARKLEGDTQAAGHRIHFHLCVEFR
jgi:hypothetical protein